MESFFNAVNSVPDDAIFSLFYDYLADKRQCKIDLSRGSYRDAEGNPYLFNTVKLAEQILIEKKYTKEYLAIDGEQNFIHKVTELILGKNCPANTYGAQTVGASSALYLGGAFLKNALNRAIYLSEQTWPPHHLIFKNCGLKIDTYPYFDEESKTINMEKLLSKLKVIPEKSIVLFHGCCHNPTGLSPTKEQWKEISKLMLEKQLFPFFDFSYQGFGDTLDEDAWAIRYFCEQGHEFFIAASFAKNFGLYAERPGLFLYVTPFKERIHPVQTNIKQQIRSVYSNPPAHGGRIVYTILSCDKLKQEWQEELSNLQSRLHEARKTFLDKFAVISSKDLSFMRNQKGMFSYGSFNPQQVLELKNKYGIYILENSRMSITGLNPINTDYFVDCIAKVFDE
ncbi:Aspartate aminotransferase [Candidatus Rubidus massiliensis]|nr:MAG: hypothetical protein BGO10_02395 [Chlamydia sp. 32-24]CDZ79921.1 Aspartate aminotransferase [Candidatus Rubidus massiliensis]